MKNLQKTVRDCSVCRFAISSILFFIIVGSSGGYGNNNYGKKKKGMSTLKKAAVIGAVAYGSYQIDKMSSGYSHWGGHPRGKYFIIVN